MRLHKSHHRLFIWVIGLLVLSACSNDNGDNQPASSASYKIQVPATLLSTPPDSTLKASIVIYNDESVEIVRIEKTSEEAESGFEYQDQLPRAVYTVVITYEVTDINNIVILTATATDTADLRLGNDSVEFTAESYTFGPCVLGSALIGGCTLL